MQTWFQNFQGVGPKDFEEGYMEDGHPHANMHVCLA